MAKCKALTELAVKGLNRSFVARYSCVRFDQCCYACAALGWSRCPSCLGRSFKRCISCCGSGRLWKTDIHGRRHVDSCWHCHGTGRRRSVGQSLVFTAGLTPSTPAVPSCCCSKGPAPCWSNPPFLIFDIRALWRSGLSARAPGCQNLITVG